MPKNSLGSQLVVPETLKCKQLQNRYWYDFLPDLPRPAVISLTWVNTTAEWGAREGSCEIIKHGYNSDLLDCKKLSDPLQVIYCVSTVAPAHTSADESTTAHAFIKWMRETFIHCRHLSPGTLMSNSGSSRVCSPLYEATLVSSQSRIMHLVLP